MSLPSVTRTETTDDRIFIHLSNGCRVPVTHDEARILAIDPQAAARFLQTWASPRSHR